HRSRGHARVERRCAPSRPRRAGLRPRFSGLRARRGYGGVWSARAFEDQYRRGVLRCPAPLRTLCRGINDRILEGVERRSQKRANPSGSDEQQLAFAAGVVRDRTRLAMGLLDDRARLAACVVTHVLRRALGGEERRPHQVLDFTMPGDLTLELVDAIGEVHPFLPDRFVARRDLGERGVDCAPAVAEETAPELDVAYLDR